jgi:radical SAM protein with 4Fe4S-binding SPASM domain
MESGTSARELYRRRVAEQDWKPRTCVWEITLACNLRCKYCGSRAGAPRRDELSTTECLEVVSQLGEAGCELVTLSGGEPTLRADWDRIAGAVAARGMRVNMVTNGNYRSHALAGDVVRRAQASGMANVGISIDGPEQIHDALRGRGTFKKARSTVELFAAFGVDVAVMTTVNRENLPFLAEVRQLAIDAGATMWRLQLAKPMGSMDDHRSLVLRPRQMLELVPLLARLKKKRGIELQVGDSIGHYGPHDRVLRGRGWRRRRECWQGCQAGMNAVGIEADGGVKGCLSLQAKWGARDPFVEGNLRTETLDQIWHRPGVFAYNREFAVEGLTGPCKSCSYGEICRGGPHCLSSAVNGLLTENPYCYHALTAGADRRQGRSAASAAAAVALFLAAGPLSSCGSRSVTTGDTGASEASTAPAGDAARKKDPTSDLGAQPAPDVLDCSAINCKVSPCWTCEYGVNPPTPPEEVWKACCCQNVCCECDYGLPPPAGCCP